MLAQAMYTNGAPAITKQLMRERYGGELYEYYPLGNYIVAAPGICGGRPTIKYTRIEVRMVLAYLAKGRTIAEIVVDYGRKELTAAATSEAIRLASQTVEQATHISQKVAV